MGHHLVRIVGGLFAAILALGAISSHAAPVVAITSPATNTQYTPPASITLTATATDSASTIAKVEFFRGTTLIGTATRSPYSVTWSNAATGRYRVTARATSAKGVRKTSRAITVVVNQPPTVTLTAPSNNSTYPAPATIQLAAATTDRDGKIAKVEFFRGSTLIGTDTVAPYRVTWRDVGPGTYSVAAKATDKLGGVTTSPPVTVTVGATTNQPPSISLTATPTQATAPATIALTAAASDSDGSVVKVDFYNGATLLGTATNAPYAVSWNNVGAGSYGVTAKATDNAGAVTTSAPVAITIGSAATQVYYIYADHLNTPRQVVDSNNNVVWEWRQDDPFGNNVPVSANGFVFNLRFPGQYFDQETGLHYNYFRDCYDPATGRYCQADPIGNVLYGNQAASSLYATRGPVDPGGAEGLYRQQPVYNQSYAYVGGNPISKTDPLGLWEVSVEFYKIFGGGITFGRDPGTGQGFITCKVGVGVGGGVTYDPLAGRPGGAKATSGTGGIAAGISGTFGGTASIGGFGISSQVDGSRGYDAGNGRWYNDPSVKGNIGYEPGGRTGISIGGSLGAQFGIYDQGR